jgi:hypothetical protein
MELSNQLTLCAFSAASDYFSRTPYIGKGKFFSIEISGYSEDD